MLRRDLLKLSPVAMSSAAAGHIAFAQTPEPTATDCLYNVRRYETTRDSKTVDTPAINRATEAVAAAGGGTLLFPAGTYVCFTIRLRFKGRPLFVAGLYDSSCGGWWVMRFQLPDELYDQRRIWSCRTKGHDL